MAGNKEKTVTCGIDRLGAAVLEALTSYSDEVAADMKAIIDEEAGRLMEAIKRDSPRRKLSGRAAGYRTVRKQSVKFERVYQKRASNRYSKGWNTRVLFENNVAKRIRVYNKTDYQLTHLLEYGHATRNGGHTQAFPHIGPNEQEVSKRMLKRIKEAAGR